MQSRYDGYDVSATLYDDAALGGLVIDRVKRTNFWPPPPQKNNTFNLANFQLPSFTRSPDSTP